MATPVPASARVLLAALLLGLLFPTPGPGQQADGRVTVPPTDPAFVGPPDPPLYDAARLEEMLQEADALPAITSLLVARRDSLIVERYWRGMRPGQAVNIKSASKTLLSPLVGIAIRDGLLEGLDQPLSELLPDYFERLRARDDWDPRKEEIRLRHLLTMQTGLETTSFANYGAWVSSTDWAWDQLRRPLRCDPGSCHSYSTGTTHLLSVILTRVSGRSLRRYMHEELLAPLDIPLGEWDRDPQGVYLGGNNMPFRPRDLLSLGRLFADLGWHDGEPLVPQAWIEASWKPRGTSPWNGHRFGYLWWSETWAGRTAHFAWGYGGQFLVVIPELDLVVVATSSLSPGQRGSSRRLRRFFDRSLVPAFDS